MLICVKITCTSFPPSPFLFPFPLPTYQCLTTRFKCLPAEPLSQVPTVVHQLTQNYRSHDGILRLASGVLDLRTKFFPESFDRMERDQGLFKGPKPTLIESAKPADLIALLKGNERETSHIEFGAHQVRLWNCCVQLYCLSQLLHTARKINYIT